MIALPCVVIAAIVLVTCKYQEPCQKQPENSSKAGATGSVPSLTQPQPQNAEGQTDDSSRCVPCRYKLLAWPLGITTWGIFGTLYVILWQSWGTADAAKSAARGIEIQEKAQRAWLVIRSAMKGYEPSAADRQLRFWWTIENRGHLMGQIIETQCRYELVEDDPICNLPPSPDYPNPIRRDGFLIHPEGVQEYFAGLYRDGKIVVPPLSLGDVGRITDGTLHLRVYGYVKYIDGLEKQRESRFIEYYAVSSTNEVRGFGFRPLLTKYPEYTKCT